MENNRAFLYGDSVSTYFFVRKGNIILAEECYFFLMASMRKMRMNIPISFTLEYFLEKLEQEIELKKLRNAFINLIVYRNEDNLALTKTPIKIYIHTTKQEEDILKIKKSIEVDVIKDITVNNNLLSNIRTHCPENIYAQIYANDNDIDDVILLNNNKRIARGISGNYLFLENNTIKIPKLTEGAYISPLMENLVTFIHKNKLATIEQVEMSPFESQKAEEILMISDKTGLFSVKKIRNKNFDNNIFESIISKWIENFEQ